MVSRLGCWMVSLALLSSFGTLAPPTLAAERLPPSAEYRLGWHVPEMLGCGSANAFVQRVEELLGRRAFSEQASSAVTMEVVKSKQGWTLNVRVLDAAGAVSAERRLVSRDGDCTGILASAALVMELMLSGEAAASTASTELNSAEANSDEHPREATSAPPKDSIPNQPTPRPATFPEGPKSNGMPATDSERIELAVLGACYLWVLPEPTLGAQLSARYEVARRWGLMLGFGLSTQWTGSRSIEDTRVKLTLALKHAEAGVNRALYRDGRWAHELGVVGLVGVLTPTVEEAHSASGPLLWAGFGPRARTELEVGWGLRVIAAGALVIPVTRERLTEKRGAVLARVPPVGGLISAGLGSRW